MPRTICKTIMGRNSLTIKAGIIIILLALVAGMVSAAPSGITITSSPSGAQVYVSGSYKGDTPLDLTGMYAPGTYQLEIRKDGYVSWTGSLAVQSGTTTSVTATLIPYSGSVTIDSVPQGASIYFDDRYYGITPATISDKPVGVHAVTLKKDGYNDWVSEVQVLKGKTITVTATLVQRTTPYDGSLNIQSTPSGAEVYFNGDYQGTTPLIVPELAPGTYQVTLRLSGYQDWVADIEIGVDEKEKISASMYPGSGNGEPTGTPLSLVPVIIGILAASLLCTYRYKK